MSDYRIPFNRPVVVGNELEYIKDALGRGHISGDGIFSRKCHALLERELGAPRVLLTTSGTQALEMAALLIGVGAGDEVIIPSFTFVSLANAFVLRGARPVFADIRADTLNMDEAALPGLITPRTKAIVPVHYAGVGSEMDAICELARTAGVIVIEDNAHGLFARYRGRYLGTLGALSALSFHETKNFTCGEGGALVINDARYVERAEIIREKGTDRTRFFRGQVDKYTWIEVGGSYLLSDLLAAFLYAQMEARAAIQARRRSIWHAYRDGLHEWAMARKVGLPVVPEWCEQSYHMFYVLLPSRADRDGLITRLRAQGILSVFHYLPLHLSPMGRAFGGKEGDCPVSEDVSERLLRLPFYNDLSEADQAFVIDTVTGFDPGRA